KVAAGPVLFDNVYVGETYDARREIADWSRPGLDDAAWKPAAVVPGPTETLISQNIPPIRKIRAITPRAVLRGKNGAWILDLGQNLGGWLQIRVREKAGQQIRMRFAELLMPSGDAIDTASIGVHVTGADQQDIYICRGGGAEEWEPRFTYHGFRYVEIDGLSGKPDSKDVTDWLLRTDLPTIGSFHTTDPRLEKFCEVSRWTLEDNLQGVLTDCPHRERCGWLGDLHACGEFAAYSLDMRDFFSRTMDDIRTTRGRGGRNPATNFPPRDPRAPGMISVGKRLCGVATPDWGMAVVLVPWFSYLHYGDLAIVRDNWDMMTDWIAFLEEFGVHDGIVTDGLGDWCPPGSNAKMEAPPTLTSTALFYQALRHMAFFAVRLGKTDESRRYAARADIVQAAFLRRFIQPNGGFGSQTGTAMALWSDLVPTDKTDAAVAALENDIMVRNKGHYTTGIFGHRCLYTVLNDNGGGAVSRTLWGRDDWPSLGFLTEKHDLTTWPEVPMDWPTGARYPRNSFNHPMQSGFAATFYESLAGIRPDPAQPGYKKTLLQPTFLEGVGGAGASLASPYGVVQSTWERAGNHIVWKVTIPPNTTAEARLAATVQGMLLGGSTGARLLRTERGRRVYALDSGTHTLRLTL
ncbi:MAG: glycoside hydrolase family 78 protein, partial [Armatimonadota bacterium]|nr:glycoside hydrolase family 78 protein [Armatimonadota bacterium]